MKKHTFIAVAAAFVAGLIVSSILHRQFDDGGTDDTRSISDSRNHVRKVSRHISLRPVQRSSSAEPGSTLSSSTVTLAPVPDEELDDPVEVTAGAPIIVRRPGTGMPEKTPRSTEELGEVLADTTDDTGETRLHAVRELLGKGLASDDDAPAVAETLKYALNDPYIPVRGEALEALVQLGDPDAQQLALDWLASNEPERDPLQHVAIRCAVRMRQTDQLPAIRRHLDNKDSFTRITAIVALGALGDEDSRDDLMAACEDENYRIARAAARSVAKLDKFRAMRADGTLE